MKVVTTRRGVRLMHAGHVVSEVLSAPGPTHSVFDVLAASAFLAPPGGLCLLGFAGGGILAPLHQLGYRQKIDAVDLSDEGVSIFRKYVEPWAGPVRFHLAEASQWLRRCPRQYGAVMDDLSIQEPGDVWKPEVSLTTLPRLLKQRWSVSGGWSITNVLPIRGHSRAAVLKAMGMPVKARRLIHLRDFENKILIGSHSLPTARALSHQLRSVLDAIGSRLREGLRVESF